jgi:hypothetical protein
MHFPGDFLVKNQIPEPEPETRVQGKGKSNQKKLKELKF